LHPSLNDIKVLKVQNTTAGHMQENNTSGVTIKSSTFLNI